VQIVLLPTSPAQQLRKGEGNEPFPNVFLNFPLVLDPAFRLCSGEQDRPDPDPDPAFSHAHELI
jgi:hypothetical protein